MVVFGIEDGSFLAGVELLDDEQAAKRIVMMIPTMILDLMSVSFYVEMNCPTVCVSGRADGRDSFASQNPCQQAAAYPQGEALSAARCVGWRHLLFTTFTIS
jgi:hypothetical protein